MSSEVAALLWILNSSKSSLGRADLDSAIGSTDDASEILGGRNKQHQQIERIHHDWHEKAVVVEYQARIEDDQSSDSIQLNKKPNSGCTHCWRTFQKNMKSK